MTDADICLRAGRGKAICMPRRLQRRRAARAKQSSTRRLHLFAPVAQLDRAAVF
jgi:hypothetical protein